MLASTFPFADTAELHAFMQRELERPEVNDAIAEILLTHAREHPRPSPLATLPRANCTP